jgi:K+-sensing histidine kinase KdpD
MSAEQTFPADIPVPLEKRPVVGSEATGRVRGWLTERSRADARGYATGFLAVVLAAVIGVALAPIVDVKGALLLLLGAVMIAAWSGGLGPGLATTLLAAVANASLFMRTGASLTTVPTGDAVSPSRSRVAISV